MQPKTKNKSSTRTLPLVAPFEQALLQLKEQQLENQTICGSSYNFNDQCYINVNKIGNLLKPGYLTQHFKIVLRKHGLREIRFHDLRHLYVKPTTKNNIKTAIANIFLYAYNCCSYPHGNR